MSSESFILTRQACLAGSSELFIHVVIIVGERHGHKSLGAISSFIHDGKGWNRIQKPHQVLLAELRLHLLLNPELRGRELFGQARRRLLLLLGRGGGGNRSRRGRRGSAYDDGFRIGIGSISAYDERTVGWLRTINQQSVQSVQSSSE